MNKQFNIYIEDNDYYVRAFVTVFFEKVDDSFDHEFGITRQFNWVPKEVLIESVRNPETGEEWGKLPRELTSLINAKALEKAQNMIL